MIAIDGPRGGALRKRFEDRILGFPLPPNQAGETPGVCAVERGADGWKLTRRGLMGLIAAGAFAGLTRPAYAQTCSIGAFAHQALLESLSFFPDGNTLVSAGRDSFVKFWTIPGAALFRTVSTDAVPLQVAVSPNGNQIAVAMEGGHLELWSADGATRRALVGHTSAVNGVAFTPDGSQLVSVSADRTTKVWSVSDASLLTSFADSTDVMAHAAVARLTARAAPAAQLRSTLRRPERDQRLLITSGAQLHLRLLSSGVIQKTVAGKAFALSPDGAFLAAHDGVRLYIYAFPSLAPLVWVVENLGATSLAFSADGKRLAIAYTNAPARLYSAPDLTLLRAMEANDGPCLSTAMDARNTYLAVASGKSIRLYRLPSGSRVLVCFMDIAASSPASTGIQYTWGGVGYHGWLRVWDSVRRRVLVRLRARRLPMRFRHGLLVRFGYGMLLRLQRRLLVRFGYGMLLRFRHRLPVRLGYRLRLCRRRRLLLRFGYRLLLRRRYRLFLRLRLWLRVRGRHGLLLRLGFRLRVRRRRRLFLRFRIENHLPCVWGLSTPVIAIQTPVLHRLRQVLGGNRFAAGEVGYSARDLQYAVVRAGGKAHFADGHFQGALSSFIQHAELPNLARG
jgi:hypothetical protein